MTVEEEIKSIEEEITKTPYNKATQKHIGKLKAKLAKLKENQIKKVRDKAGVGYGVKKQGDATVLLVGFPSVGKSTLINKLTAADSKVGDYEFTTLDIIPGMMNYNGANIQILDIPGIIEGAATGKGRGKAVLSVVRNADLVLIMVDAREPKKQIETIKKELYSAGFRLDEKKPKIRLYKKDRGGINIITAKNQHFSTEQIKNAEISTSHSSQSDAETSRVSGAQSHIIKKARKDEIKLTKEAIISVMNEFGLYNADLVILEKIDLDKLIDFLASNRVYIPSLTVVNKVDIKDVNIANVVKISALKNQNIDLLKEIIWKKLELMRIYLKKIGKEPDLKEPLIMKKGAKVKDVSEKIHKEVLKNFKYARIWGSSKFPGQIVGLEYELKDKDIVELHVK